MYNLSAYDSSLAQRFLEGYELITMVIRFLGIYLSPTAFPGPLRVVQRRDLGYRAAW